MREVNVKRRNVAHVTVARHARLKTHQPEMGSACVLVFVDESEWPRPKDPDGFTVWGCIAIHPKRSRDFSRQIYELERKFWKISEPYKFEIKGRLLLKKNFMTSPKKQEFCDELLSLCKLTEVKAFAYGLRNSDALSSGDLEEPVVYRAYSRLLERVNAMMSEDHQDDMAIVALDSQDEQTDTARARAFGNYLYGNPLGRQLSYIVETPFFVNSKATLGIQLADLVAYVLAHQNQGRPDIKHVVDRVRELEWRSSLPSEFPKRGFRFEDLQTPTSPHRDAGSFL